jgi:hypothetical protein
MIASPNEPKSVRGARQSDARASIRFEMTRELASMPRPARLTCNRSADALNVGTLLQGWYVRQPSPRAAFSPDGP